MNENDLFLIELFNEHFLSGKVGYRRVHFYSIMYDLHDETII